MVALAVVPLPELVELFVSKVQRRVKAPPRQSQAAMTLRV